MRACVCFIWGGVSSLSSFWIWLSFSLGPGRCWDLCRTPERREVGLTKGRGACSQLSFPRGGELASLREQCSGLSLSGGLLEYRAGLWLFRFIIVGNAFRVSFPGSLAPPALRCFPLPACLDFCEPLSPHPAGSLRRAKPLGLCVMCFARGDLPRPFRNGL